MFVVRDEIKEKIMTNYVEKSYEYDVESLIHGRRRWKRTGQAFETMSKIFLAVGGILSFSSYYYKLDTLSFASGSVSVISLGCLQFSSFCYLENKKQSNELNVVLRKLGMETIPELSRELENIQIQRTPPDYVNMKKIADTTKNTHVINISDHNHDKLPGRENVEQNVLPVANPKYTAQDELILKAVNIPIESEHHNNVSFVGHVNSHNGKDTQQTNYFNKEFPEKQNTFQGVPVGVTNDDLQQGSNIIEPAAIVAKILGHETLDNLHPKNTQASQALPTTEAPVARQRHELGFNARGKPS